MSINKWTHIYLGNKKWMKKSGLKLASWNCGSGYLSKGKKWEVENFIKTQNIDIMAVSEVEMNKSKFHQEALYSIDGYTMHLPPSWTSIGKARLILYVKDSIKSHVTVRQDLSPLTQPVIWIQVNSTPKLFFSFIYREWTDWRGDKTLGGQLKRLSEILEKSKKVTNENITFFGDMNINAEDIKNDETCPLASQLHEFMLEMGLELLDSKPTRGRMVGDILQQSTIDLVLTSNKEKITHFNLHEASSSDHSVLTFNWAINEDLKPKPVTARNFNKFNQEKFESDLMEMNWNFEELAVDDAVERFNDNILTCLNDHAPWTTFIPRSKSNPLISKETIYWIKLREKAHKKAKKTKNPEDVKTWKSLRNKVVGLIVKDKKKADFLDFSDSKKAWKFYNDLKRNRHSKTGPPDKLLINGSEVSDEKTLAEVFNDFFISKIKKLKQKLEANTPAYDPITHLQRFVPNDLPMFSFKPITTEEVTEAIKNVKNTKSTGTDNISYSTLKLASTTIAKPLASIFNISLNTGAFPRAWLDTTVLPLHKKHSKLDVSNYRNICLVSKSGLVFEKIIQKQITDHFLKFDLFSKSQHAYLPGRSTSTLCTTLYDRCCRAANEGKYAGVLSCDLKSGFDLIDGNILTRKFAHCYKASERTTMWLKSYMTGRTQSVLIRNVRSKVKKSESSLGQGTKLAPLLFSIAISDLPNAIENGEADLFADDYNETVVDNDPTVVVAKLQDDATKVEKWLHSNKLALAEDKTTFLLTNNRERKRDNLTDCLALVVDGEVIKQSPTICVLGITFSRDLTWTAHLHGSSDPANKGLIKSLSNIIGVVANMKNCPAEAKRLFLNACFISKLNYGSETWGALTDKQFRHLQCLQNRAANLIIKNRNIPTVEKIKKLKWLPVKEMVARSSLLLLHKIKTQEICPYFDHHLKTSRNQVFDKIPVYNPTTNSLLNKSFLPRASKLWNQLSDKTRRLPAPLFKASISALLRTGSTLQLS